MNFFLHRKCVATSRNFQRVRAVGGLLLCAGLLTGGWLLCGRWNEPRHVQPLKEQHTGSVIPPGDLKPSDPQVSKDPMDRDGLMKLALSDPERYLASLESFTVGMFEKGMVDPSEMVKTLLPPLEAALTALWHRDQALALQSLEGIKFSSTPEILFQSELCLIRLGMAADPSKTAADIALFGGVFAHGPDVAQLWAQTDPGRAAAWSVGADPSGGSMRAVLMKWLESDSDVAQQWIFQLQPGARRTSALSFLMRQLPGTESALAPVITGLLKNMDSASDASGAAAITDALIKWKRGEPETLARWIEEQEQTAHGERLIESMAVAQLLGGPSKSTAALSPLLSQAQKESAVTETAARMLDSADHVKVWKILAGLEDPSLRATAFESVLADAARLGTSAVLPATVKSLKTDPETTLNAIRQLSRNQPGVLNHVWSNDAVEKALADVGPEQRKLFTEAMTPEVENPQ